MNFTVTARGRQFDRLALMYLGDVEGMDPITTLKNEDLYVMSSLQDINRRADCKRDSVDIHKGDAAIRRTMGNEPEAHFLL